MNPEYGKEYDEDLIMVCDCGCEVYRGRVIWENVEDGYVVMPGQKNRNKLRTLCIRCYIEEMQELFRKQPYTCAEAMGLEAVTSEEALQSAQPDP